MWTPPPLSFCSSHGSVLGIGSPHGSEKTFPHQPRPCKRLEQFDLQLKNVYCLNEISINLINSYNRVKVKIDCIFWWTEHNLFYINRQDTVLDSTLLYSAVLYFIILFSNLPTVYPEYNGHVYIYYRQYVYDT